METAEGWGCARFLVGIVWVIGFVGVAWSGLVGGPGVVNRDFDNFLVRRDGGVLTGGLRLE